jgi:hypothetical protein
VRVNLPPFATNSTNQDEWLESINISLKNNRETILSVVPIAQSFDVKPNSRELVIKTINRRIAIDFFVTPTQLGKHPIRFEIYLGKTQLGWFQETIRINMNIQRVLTISGTIIGSIATLLSILGALKLLP